MKQTLSEMISNMQKDLGTTSQNSIYNIKLSQEIIDKYTNFKKWLDDNGAIYPKVEFPVIFSNIIGCSAKENINANDCIFFIPYKLIIDSSKLNYEKLSPSLNKNNTIKLVLFLLDELTKKEKSFYKPYIDIILLNEFSNYTPFWKNDVFLELNDEEVKRSINYYIEEINDYYQQLIKIKNMEIDFITFKIFYVFVVSRQFNISENKMLLIPLADLLNHSPYSDIKYEFFDSKNFIMKYTNESNDNNNLTEENNFKNFTNFSDFFKYKKEIPENNIIINNVKGNKKKKSKKKQENNDEKIEPFKVDYDDEENPKINIELTNNDYFVISTNNQIFKSGEQIFNNYGICSNEYLLVNFGFSLLDNPGDKTRIIMNMNKPDKKLKKFLETNFLEYFINKDSYQRENNISIELYVKKNKVCYKLGKIYKFLSYGNNKGKFNRKKEINSLDKLIAFIELKINVYELSVFKVFNILKEMIYKKGINNQNQFNITVFKLTQKMNLIYQKEMLNALKNILIKDEKENKIKSDQDFLDSVNNTNCFKSVYLKSDDIKQSLVNYLTKVIKIENTK